MCVHIFRTGYYFTSSIQFKYGSLFAKCLVCTPILTFKGSINETECVYFFVKQFDVNIHRLELCIRSLVVCSKDL